MQQQAAGDEDRWQVRRLAIPLPTLAPSMTCGQVYDLMSDNAATFAMAVLDEGRPIGLVNRIEILSNFARPYWREVYARRPVNRMMDAAPIVVDAALPVETLGQRIAAEDTARLDRGFIVVENDAYLGVGSGIDALRLVADQARAHTEALKAARDAAETASRAKSAFLANVSHELRTPLNAIIGFSELMTHALHGPLPARYNEYVRDIHSSGQMLLELINDLLDLSRAEAGRLDLREEAVDMAGVVEKCVRMLEPRAEAMGHRLEIRVGPEPITLCADRRMLSQVLLNLLSNAIKFTPKGGYITISAQSHADGRVALAVADTGIGIDHADIIRVLEPFTRLDHQHHRRFEGAGLGLPLAKRLIELHGGRLTIDSDVDVGTTATAWFPAQRRLSAGDPSAAGLLRAEVPAVAGAPPPE